MISEKELEKYRTFAAERLTFKRLNHTLAVENEAAELSRIFCPEKEYKLRAAAILHDITKEHDAEKQLQLCEKYGIMVDSVLLASPKCFHGITGAAIAAETFPGEVDTEIYDAIKYHTTGRADMTLSEKIIYLADYIEPTRTFSDCVTLRKSFYEAISDAEENNRFQVLDDILIMSFDLSIKELIECNAPIMPDTFGARNALCISKSKGI